jgi:signal peptidase I
MRIAAVFARALGWTAMGLAVGLVLGIVAPLALGQRPYTVLSGSMEPAIGTGDVVVVKRMRPAGARVGDVVTFSDPKRTGRLITHRVRSAHARGDQIDFVTKGDANNNVERWRVARSGVISRVQYRVPEVGRLALFTRTRTGLLALVLLPLLVLAIHDIVRIWRPQEEQRGGASA